MVYRKIILLFIILSFFLDVAKAQNPIFYSPENPCDSSILYFYTDTSNLNRPDSICNFGAQFKWFLDSFLIHSGNMYPINSGYEGSVNLLAFKYWPISNYIHGIHNLRMVIHDTLCFPLKPRYSFDTTITIYIDSTCNGNFIRGKVYNDINKNGQMDSLEIPIENTLIELSDGNHKYYQYTDNLGNYRYQASMGYYKVKIVPYDFYKISQPHQSNGYSFFFNGTNIDSSDNDFGIYVTDSIYDLSISLSSSVFRPGFEGFVFMTIENKGSLPQNAKIELSLDSSLSFLASSHPVDSINNGKLYFNTGILSPQEFRKLNIKVEIDSTLPIGLHTGIASFVLPIYNDSFPQNNFDTLSQFLVGSYDPNDKIAYPSDDSVNTVLPNQPLIYTIRFQNTGNYYADRVRLVDKIEPNLDINSIEILASSHNYTYQIDSLDEKIVFVFDSILLPWTQLNEMESHGYVKFQILPDSNLTIGDTIYNSAAIYFDFNPPIFTDTVVSTIDTVSSILTIKTLDQNINMVIYPNPTSGTFKIIGLNKRRSIIRMFDFLGNEQRIKLKSEEGKHVFDANHLTPGLYLLKIFDGENSFTQKLLIER